jgi:hypothetical protein
MASLQAVLTLHLPCSASPLVTTVHASNAPLADLPEPTPAFPSSAACSQLQQVLGLQILILICSSLKDICSEILFEICGPLSPVSKTNKKFFPRSASASRSNVTDVSRLIKLPSNQRLSLALPLSKPPLLSNCLTCSSPQQHHQRKTQTRKHSIFAASMPKSASHSSACLPNSCGC